MATKATKDMPQTETGVSKPLVILGLVVSGVFVGYKLYKYFSCKDVEAEVPSLPETKDGSGCTKGLWKYSRFNY